MKKIFIVFIIIFFIVDFSAQDIQGIITYERSTFRINMMTKFPWITQEDIDRNRLTWGKNEGKWKQKFDLKFANGKSLYKLQETDVNYGYSRKKREYQIFRDYNEDKMKDKVSFLSHDYLVEGKVPKYKWKILNEIKDIKGYMCMKAVTTDSIKNIPIYAWFTNQIPFRGGPEGYSGLPGMILSLELYKKLLSKETTSVLFKANLHLRMTYF